MLFLVGTCVLLFYVPCALHKIRVFDLKEIVLALGTDHWIHDGEGRGLDKYPPKNGAYNSNAKEKPCR